jgi:ATP-dependent RNA helicase DHX57
MASGMSVGRSPLIKVELDKHSEESSDNLIKEKILKQRATEYELSGKSDILFLGHLFLRWKESVDKKAFCDRLGLSISTMKEMKQLYLQLDDSLSAIGFFDDEESNKNTKSWRLIRACLVSALSPTQLVRVERAAAKYAETSEGSVEIEGIAKDLRFYTRGDQNCGLKKYHDIPEERVFIHPSSMNFAVSSYSCPWIVYHELVRTSKAFLRDTTECSAYALLLFGGELKVEASKNLIWVDGYVRLSANAKVGALLGGLRRKIDDILLLKVSDPTYNVSSSIEMKLIIQLIVSDGLM